MLLKDLQTLATKLATGTLFHVEKAGKAYSVDYSALAKAIIEEYADSTVGGSKQSVQAAIAALNSRTDGIKTDNFSMDMADTYTKTLDFQSIYLITVGKLNSSNGNYNGMYLVTTHRVVSSIRTIVSSDAVDSITINAGTLSITTKTTYTIASIMRLALIS